MAEGADDMLESLPVDTEEDAEEVLELPVGDVPGQVSGMATASALMLVDKLTETNYSISVFKVEHLLKREGLWTFVKNSPQNPSPALKEADEKALALIVLSLLDSQLVYVRETTTSKEAWDNLKGVHAHCCHRNCSCSHAQVVLAEAPAQRACSETH